MLRALVFLFFIAGLSAHAVETTLKMHYGVTQRDEVSERNFTATNTSSDLIQLELTKSVVLRSLSPSFASVGAECEVAARAMTQTLQAITRIPDTSLPSDDGGHYRISFRPGAAGEAFMIVSWKNYFKEITELLQTLGISAAEMGMPVLPFEYETSAVVTFTQGDWDAFVRGEEVAFEVAEDDETNILERSIPAFEVLLDRYFKSSLTMLAPKGLVTQKVSGVGRKTTMKAQFSGTRNNLSSYGPIFERSIGVDVEVELPEIALIEMPTLSFELHTELLLTGEKRLSMTPNDVSLEQLRRTNLKSATMNVGRELLAAGDYKPSDKSVRPAEKLKIARRALDNLNKAIKIFEESSSGRLTRQDLNDILRYHLLRKFTQNLLEAWESKQH